MSVAVVYIMFFVVALAALFLFRVSHTLRVDGRVICMVLVINRCRMNLGKVYCCSNLLILVASSVRNEKGRKERLTICSCLPSSPFHMLLLLRRSRRFHGLRLHGKERVTSWLLLCERPDRARLFIST